MIGNTPFRPLVIHRLEYARCNSSETENSDNQVNVLPQKRLSKAVRAYVLLRTQGPKKCVQNCATHVRVVLATWSLRNQASHFLLGTHLRRQPRRHYHRVRRAPEDAAEHHLCQSTHHPQAARVYSEGLETTKPQMKSVGMKRSTPILPRTQKLQQQNCMRLEARRRGRRDTRSKHSLNVIFNQTIQRRWRC